MISKLIFFSLSLDPQKLNDTIVESVSMSVWNTRVLKMASSGELSTETLTIYAKGENLLLCKLSCFLIGTDISASYLHITSQFNLFKIT